MFASCALLPCDPFSMTAPLATNHPTMPVPEAPRTARARRWIAIGLVSILAHLVLLDALPRFDSEPGSADDEPLRARLVPLPPAVPETPPPTPAPPPRVESKPNPTPRRSLKPIEPAEFVPQSLTDQVPEVALGGATPHAGAAPAPVAASPPPPAPAPAAPPLPPPPSAIAPQSVRLAYKVVAVDRKNASPLTYYGIGSIDWSNDGARYRVDMLASIDLLLFKLDVLSSHSEGAIDAQGLQPDRYTEKPRKRPTLATNFNRDSRQSISFSASTASFGLVPGAQDRLSVIFQIGSLLQANPALAAGGHLDIPVAGVRDLDTWVFDAQGIEAADTGDGPRPTVHLRRVPKPGSNDRSIDVWVTQAEGVPARVLYTEPDGSTVDMTLDRIEAPPRHDG